MDYIDFDGVILDTEENLFRDWRKNPNYKMLSENTKINYIQNVDWHSILLNSQIINDSIYYLKQMDPTTSAILTRIHSLENEGGEKVKFIRSHGIKQPIILNPYNVEKCDMVDPVGSRLVDDNLWNLVGWEEKGGIPIFFDMDDNNIDSWNRENTYGYKRVLDLSSLLNRRG